MSIATCASALRDVLATAVEARVKADTMLAGMPLAFPAVVVTWAGSKAARRLNYGHDDATGKWKWVATRATHRFEVWVLLSTTQHAEAEGAAMMTTAQAVIDGLRRDATLRGSGAVDRCTSVTMTDLRPYQTTVNDSTVLAGIAGMAEVEEELP